jgi:hypothetical protein
MISYNDVLEISKLYQNKQYDKLLQFINKKLPSVDIIEFLNKCIDEKFIEDSDCIKLQFDKKELIVYKDDFLKDLPFTDRTIYPIDKYHITIGYPTTSLILPASCIKKIQHGDVVLDINTSDYNNIPLSLVKKCTPYIEKYINKLNDTYIYYVNKKHNSRFTYSKEVIIHIVYLCFIQNYNNLLEQQLLLMKQFNFTYQDFNHTSYNSICDYLKIVKKSMSKNE